MRSHDCPCGFRNEFEIAVIDHAEPNPPIDLDELELCPAAGCKRLVAIGRVFRLLADPVDMARGAGG